MVVQLGDLVFTWGRAQVRYTIDPNGSNPTYETYEVNFPGVGSFLQRLDDLGITVVQNPTSITLTSRRGAGRRVGQPRRNILSGETT